MAEELAAHCEAMSGEENRGAPHGGAVADVREPHAGRGPAVCVAVVVFLCALTFAAVAYRQTAAMEQLTASLEQLTKKVETLANNDSVEVVHDPDLGKCIVPPDDNTFWNARWQALISQIEEFVLVIVSVVCGNLLSPLLKYAPAKLKKLWAKWSPVLGFPPEHVSQETMMKKFKGKILEKGKPHIKVSRVLARKAKKGEKITTVIWGEPKTVKEVENDDDMVVRDETFNKELRVLPRITFEALYKDEADINIDKDPVLKPLQEAGFKRYTPKGKIFVYTALGEDVAEVPSGYFWAAFGKEPQKLEEGTDLAMGFPSYNARDIYKFHGKAMYKELKVLDQKQVLEKFKDKFYPSGESREMKFTGNIWARQAMERGLSVCTYQHTIERVCHAETTFGEDMIVRSNTVDAEHRIWRSDDFDREFEEDNDPAHDPGIEVMDIETVEQKGYKKYKSKSDRKVRMYKVQEEDLGVTEDCPELWMKGRRGDLQQIETGHHLARTIEGDFFVVRPEEIHQYEEVHN